MMAAGCQHLMNQDLENNEVCLRILQANPNVFPHTLTPQGFVHDHPPLGGFPLSKP